jgi:hypothetical protein
MWQNGRPVDPHFEPTEALYYRCTPGHVINDGQSLSPAGIKFPNTSVNRGKYSEPEDVLISPVDKPIPGIELMKIAVFSVQDVTFSITLPLPAKSCDFKVEHVPLPDNYSHSEVRAYKDGKFEEKTSFGETVKKEYRARLAKVARIWQKPEA